jgi:hypothetical protein
VIVAVVVLALGSSASADASSQARIWLAPGEGYQVNVHRYFSAARSSSVLADVRNGSTVPLECWHDGGWAKLNYWTNRWFQVTVANGVEPITGWITASAIRKSEQPRLPRCVWVVYQLGDGSSYGEWQAPSAASPPSSTTPSPTPSPTPTPTPEPAAPTYPETTGGVAHTWTNYTNAGGYEGPSVPANATIEIACALTGFRVADGNTWWYRIAQSPWNGAYYVSADAFYNNGATSGSLAGTPFVDPQVRGC